MNRETWLTHLLNALRPMFAARGRPIPDKTKVSCGWPKSSRRGAIGECWTPRASAGGVTEIFVAPSIEDAVDAGAVLVHEAVHAAVGVEAGHRSAFRHLALAVGLEGPMRSTVAGEELRVRLNALTEKIGPYPHDCLTQAPDLRLAHWPKKQSTRQLKAQCPACGYTIRVARKWLARGYPTCPCGVIISRVG